MHQAGGLCPGGKNESELPVYPIFRLYMTDSETAVESDDAAIMASCRVSTWGGQQAEAYSHRHIGWPHGGHSIFSLEMRLQDSKYKGSIHYAAQRWYGDAWDEGQTEVRSAQMEPMTPRLWVE